MSKRNLKLLFQDNPEILAILESKERSLDNKNVIEALTRPRKAIYIETKEGQVVSSRGPKGRDGHDPVKGEDYFTPEEVSAFLQASTPEKGVDYFNKEDIKEFLSVASPKRGVDFFDGKDGKPGKDGKDGEPGYTPIKGIDYNDGKDGLDGDTDTPDEVVSKVNEATLKINAERIEGMLTVDDVAKEVKQGGKHQLELKDIKGMPLNMNDMRWHGGGQSVTIKTEDGTVSVSPLKVLKVTDGTLTNDGNGTVTLDTGGGSGGTPGAPNHSVQTNCAGVFTGKGYIDPVTQTFSTANTTPTLCTTDVGFCNTNSGEYSTTVGYQNNASCDFASSAGFCNTASACCSNAFGFGNCSSETLSSTLGACNISNAVHASAIGFGNTSSGYQASAFGTGNSACGTNTAAFGIGIQNLNACTLEIGPDDSNKLQIALGGANFCMSPAGTVSVNGVPLIGCADVNKLDPIEVGRCNTASGGQSSAVGLHNSASGYRTQAFGAENVLAACAQTSSAFGYGNNICSCQGSAFGASNCVSDNFSTALGYANTSSAYGSITAGFANNTCCGGLLAMGFQSTAQNTNNTAIGYQVCNSVANSVELGWGYTEKLQISCDGVNLVTAGTAPNFTINSVAITNNLNPIVVGRSNTATGACDSAVGFSNIASCDASSAFGYQNIASGCFSSAFGYCNFAPGCSSAAFGAYNVTNSDSSLALGYNNGVTGNYSSSVGSNNTISVDCAAVLGIGITNATTCSVEIGPSDAAKVSVNANGFCVPYGTIYGCCVDLSGDAHVGGKLTVDGPIDPTYIDLVEQTTPVAGPAAGSDRIYFKSDNLLYRQLPDASECVIGGLSSVNDLDPIEVGFGNVAAGGCASGMGYCNVASGASSVAFGWGNTASDYRSMAFGVSSCACGLGGLAMGYNTTTSSGYYSSAIGMNIHNVADNSLEIGPDDSDKLQISAAGVNFCSSMGCQFYVNGTPIGQPSAPADTFQYNNAGFFGSTGCFVPGNCQLELGLGNTIGAGNSIIYGICNASAGNLSSAFGFNSSSSGDFASSVGIGNAAYGEGSMAFGLGNVSDSCRSNAFGWNNQACTGDFTSAFGVTNIASGLNSSAFGFTNVAGGDGSVAFGCGNFATCTDALSVGIGNTACGNCASIFGQGIINSTAGTTEVGYTDSGKISVGPIGLTLSTVGQGFLIKEGTDATMGTATLSSGTATVSTTKVTANSRIFLTINGGTLTNVGAVYVSARTAGTSFVISSLNTLDASTVAWVILEPSP